MLSSTFLKKIVFKHSFLFKTWTTVPKVLLWSLTVILCRQQGKQSEAAGLDISNIIGVPSPSVRVRVKGLLKEQFENTGDNQGGGVPGGAGAETAAVAVTEAEAGIPRKPVKLPVW